MLNIHRETSSDKRFVLIRLEGEATIESAEQLMLELRDGLNADSVAIDCSGTESIDLYAFQLLCSAHRTAVAEKKTLEFLGEVTESVAQEIQSAGLTREHGCSLCPEDSSCLWSGQHSSSAN